MREPNRDPATEIEDEEVAREDTEGGDGAFPLPKEVVDAEVDVGTAQ